MDKGQLLKEIITPVLIHLDMDSPSAQNLLLGTMAQESLMGRYIVQVKGPALGVYQMEPATHDDIWKNYLAFRPELAEKVKQLLIPGIPVVQQLVFNLWYATAMARIHYWRIPYPLPDADDIEALGEYWDTHYNRNPLKGTVSEFVTHYRKYAL